MADRLIGVVRLGDCLPHETFVKLGSPHSDEVLEGLSSEESMKQQDSLAYRFIGVVRLGDCLPPAVLVELGSPHSDEA